MAGVMSGGTNGAAQLTMSPGQRRAPTDDVAGSTGFANQGYSAIIGALQPTTFAGQRRAPTDDVPGSTACPDRRRVRASDATRAGISGG